MNRIIIIRYGELHLKGANRGYFERLLIADIKNRLKGIACTFETGRGRYIISDCDETNSGVIMDRLTRIFGIHSFSEGIRCRADMDDIQKCCADMMKEKRGTFKVETNRADKKFPLTSPQISCSAGDYILKTIPGLSVDLHRPQVTISIDIREEGFVFIFCDKIMGAGGMPLASAGNGLLLLSGGLDSPVAGFMAARRGLKLVALHFHSYPYTNEKAVQKVFDLAGKLASYTAGIKVITIKLTKIQEEIHKNCSADYMITLLRMVMMKIANLVAKAHNCGCVINGESLGQVASQTLESIIVTNSIATLPVFRPLIGMDKQEIIDRAKVIETYDISILPFEDCCTVFLPEHPVTKPTLQKALNELCKIQELDRLIDEAVAARETISIMKD